MGVTAGLTRAWLTRSVKGFHFTNQYDSHLPYGSLDHTGLYVHIPFCRSICNFCPYCKEVYRQETCDAYIDALLREIDMAGAMHEGRKEVTSLYFGGGSPALAISRIGEIIAHISTHFIIMDGIGIELHPQDVTIPVLEALKDAGVTRISIGIQSFHVDASGMLDRERVDTAAMRKALHAVPFETVSMDFIFALPGQKAAQLYRDIDTAIETGANHVALYPFINFAFAPSTLPEMKRTEKKRLLDAVTAYCRKKGLVRTSLWTFSHRDASGYSSMTRDNYLGFGCSATTLLKDSFKVNTFSTKAYMDRIKEGSLPTSLTIRFTKRQRMAYYLFWKLYGLNVDAHAFETFFAMPLQKAYGVELFLARLLGFVQKKAEDYVLTDKGAFYFHHYENYYTYAYIDKMWGLMRREAFPAEMTL